MVKKTVVVDTYVRVEPHTRYLPASLKTPDYLRNMCRSIKDAIRRHVDDVGDIHIITETEDVCEHCGYAWSGDDDKYNGGCCNDDDAAYQAALSRADAVEKGEEGC